MLTLEGLERDGNYTSKGDRHEKGVQQMFEVTAYEVRRTFIISFMVLSLEAKKLETLLASFVVLFVSY